MSATKNVGLFGQQFVFPAGWAREYPAGMEMTDTDAMAVASGVLERYRTLREVLRKAERVGRELRATAEALESYPMARLLCPSDQGLAGLWACLDDLRAQYREAGERLPVQTEAGTWVEPLGGVPFDEVDIVYLDFLYSERFCRSVPERLWDRSEGKRLIFWDWSGRDGKRRVNPLYYALDEYRWLRADRWTESSGTSRRDTRSWDGKVAAHEQFDSLENYLTRKLQKLGLEDADGFSGEDGWVDRGLISGRVLIHAEFFDRAIPDRSPFGQLSRLVERHGLAGPDCAEDVAPRRRNLKGQFEKTVEPTLVSPRGVEESEIVLVPLREAFATWFRLRVEAGVPEHKEQWESNGRARKTLQMECGGKTYVFPARHAPVFEVGCTEPVDFQDMWAAAALEVAENEIESLRLGVRAAGKAALDALDEAAGGTTGERYRRAKRAIWGHILTAMRAVYFHWESRDTSAVSRVLTERYKALLALARRTQRELHAAATYVRPPEDELEAALGKLAPYLGAFRRAMEVRLGLKTEAPGPEPKAAFAGRIRRGKDWAIVDYPLCPPRAKGPVPPPRKPEESPAWKAMVETYRRRVTAGLGG